ncbi:hypothetical protein [Puniceibacterium sp. IMCC21224]|uniref:hypothetical protein n=1 Tax=Puniceibacterium sp. IMCC21224 TaxID=1618204 RepID=UPI00064DF64D|nr:hypothetical protein [Puniceibacterium sp. IMCC21224]KMK66597.1 hypothetical protein IMCC21224_111449 [Puniceibacterium sp. IMCC21224]
MTQMQISATETGTLRVFHIDLPAQAIHRFTTQAGTGEWPLQYALGAKNLRSSFVEVVSIRDLEQMTLSTYLAEGYGLSGSCLESARQQLDGIKGHVLLLPASAFGNVAQTLTIASPLRWVATFSEKTRPASLNPLRSAGAKGVLAEDTGTDANTESGAKTLRGLLMVACCIVLLVLGMLLLKVTQ